jgi:hypothetical protein
MNFFKTRLGFLAPYSLYLLVGTIAFFPCLFLGQSYYVNDLIYQFGPFRQFLKDQLMSGHFPLWNPYIYGGQPFFANPNSMMCYLPTYLTLFFPTGFGMSLFYVLHMAIAGAGMHAWLKALRLSDKAVRIGALAYALSGFYWWEVIHLHILADYALFPVLMAALELLRQNWAPRWAFAAGLIFAVIFDCGSFQSTSWILYIALAYILFRFFVHEHSEHSHEAAAAGIPWKKAGLILLFAFWGVLPLFVHLIPAKEFSDLSNRRPQGQTYENFNGIFSMKPSTIYEFLFPTISVPPGDSIDNAIQMVSDQTNYGNDYLATYGYFGVWVPFFLFFAFQRKDKKFLYFISALGIFSLLTAWGRFFPLHRLLCDYLPTIELSRAPFRFVEGYVLFACVLLAYGFQTLERHLDENKKSASLAIGAVVYALLLCAIALTRPDQTWREILALVLGAIGFSLWGFTESWKKIGRWTLMTALILPLFLAGWGDFKTAPSSNFNFEDNFPSFLHLRQRPSDERYYFDRSLYYMIRSDDKIAAIPYPENLAVPERLKDLGGYSPIVMMPIFELHYLPLQTQMDLFAVKGVIFGKDQGDQPEFTHEDMQSAQLYLKKNPPSYVNAPNDIQIAPDHLAMLKMMGVGTLDPARQVFFDQPLPKQVTASLPKEKAKLTYELKKDEVDEQTYSVHLDKNSIVTFSETAYPGWKAYLDGQPTPIYTANDAFRALFVPVGNHQIEFKYQPVWFYPLIALLGIWFVPAFFYAVWLYASREKETEPAV